MARTFLRYQMPDGAGWAERIGDRWHRIAADDATTGDLIRALRAGGGPAIGEAIGIDGLSILSPITRNQQFVAQATNYRAHVRETGGDPDAVRLNVFFTKAPSSLCGARDAIIRPDRVRLLDYEIELGLVIARDIRGPVKVTGDNLLDWVGALVIVNDVSARDVQIPEGQFFKGKSFRTFSPAGPWLVVPEPGDAAALAQLRLTLSVNGEVRQDSGIDDMIFHPPATITELSSVMDLDAGDLLITGTPGGVALHPPGPFAQKIAALLSPRRRFAAFIKGQLRRPHYLKPGDVVRARIIDPSGTLDLGEQCNTIVAAS